MGKNKNKKNNAAKAANTNDPDAIKVFINFNLHSNSLTSFVLVVICRPWGMNLFRRATIRRRLHIIRARSNSTTKTLSTSRTVSELRENNKQNDRV